MATGDSIRSGDDSEVSFLGGVSPTPELTLNTAGSEESRGAQRDAGAPVLPRVTPPGSAWGTRTESLFAVTRARENGRAGVQRLAAPSWPPKHVPAHPQVL